MHSDHPYTHPQRALRTPWNQRSSNYKPVLGLLAALVCMAYPVQASASALTLEDALRISAVEHPSVLARRSERNAADARLDVAERQQYPNLSFQSTGDGFGGRANTVRVEQPLWLGGRIKAGIDSANASILQAEAGVLQAQTDIMLKVVASFTELGRIAAATRHDSHHRSEDRPQHRLELHPQADCENTQRIDGRALNFKTRHGLNILFIHQNFPGQFRHLAPALKAQGHQVMAMTIHAGTEGAKSWGGVPVVAYTVRGRNTVGLHPWLVDIETKTLRAEACWRAAREIKAQGFSPDLIVAHPGWGEALFLKQVWPQAKLVLYAEYFYQAAGADLGFDPEFGSEDPDAQACRVQLKNLTNLAHLDQAYAAISPTQWQADTFPDAWRQRIRVIHDGIDTDALCPLPQARFTLAGDIRLSRSDEVVTYVARHLDPYRGVHVFMRALPALLQRRPHAHIVVVGGDGKGYGAAAPAGKSWREIFTDEVKDTIPAEDWARVRFVGRLGRQEFTSLLQVSRVHVYLSYPFVLSWSLIEAMSVGCSIVASNTAPVREAITNGEHGELVDFFDGPGLVNRISSLLDDTKQREHLGSLARQRAVERYDLKRVCLPQQLTWINSLEQR